MNESRRLQCLSYRLYMEVNESIVGTERVIQIRRTVTNLWNDYNALHSTLTNDPLCRHLSGSYAEGFRFRSSDKDYMYVLRRIIVTDDPEHYDNHNDNMTLLSMETHRCRPGFSLLRLEHIPPSRDETVTLVTRSCNQLPHGVYVSSLLWREGMPRRIPNGQLHGPCDSGVIGITEVDLAYCLRCYTWPKSAVDCINRLHRVGWPSADVLCHILNEGCHMVSIGAKGSHYEDTEWRISFSFAEKTLIHQMNHCQFLCYGLLKIFLKEAIKKRENEESLICSYFLKTAVFWEICNGRTQWHFTTFLQYFWACFRRLISWVYNGYCPNFFIPENNMFYGKIQGRARLELLDHLMVLHNEGYNCLLKCPSLQPLLVDIANQPIVPMLLLSENAVYSNSYYAIFMIHEISKEQPTDFVTLRDVQISLQTLSLLSDPNDALKCLALSTWERYATQFLLVHSLLVRHYVHNEEMHHYMRVILKILKNKSVDLLHHSMLSCVFLYRCGFYRIAIKVLLHAKSKLQQPNVMYDWNLTEEKYRAAGGEHTPLTTMMKKVVACTLDLPMDICVPEMTMEHQAYLLGNSVHFPPLHIVNFLLYLSYYRQGQFTEADIVVEEFAVLLAFGNEQHIHPLLRAISLTMLGICQEMSGQLTNAYHSYTEALHDQHSLFKDSTRVRIDNVCMKMNSEYQQRHQ